MLFTQHGLRPAWRIHRTAPYTYTHGRTHTNSAPHRIASSALRVSFFAPSNTNSQNGPDELALAAVKTLEVWVDNLNPEFLEPAMAEVISDLMHGLWALLKYNNPLATKVGRCSNDHEKGRRDNSLHARFDACAWLPRAGFAARHAADNHTRAHADMLTCIRLTAPHRRRWRCWARWAA